MYTVVLEFSQTVTWRSIDKWVINRDLYNFTWEIIGFVWIEQLDAIKFWTQTFFDLMENRVNDFYAIEHIKWLSKE